MHEYKMSGGRIVADPGMAERVGLPDDLNKAAAAGWSPSTLAAPEFYPGVEAHGNEDGDFVVSLTLDGDAHYLVLARGLGEALEAMRLVLPVVRGLAMQAAAGLEYSLASRFREYDAEVLRAEALLIAAGWTREEVDQRREEVDEHRRSVERVLRAASDA